MPTRSAASRRAKSAAKSRVARSSGVGGRTVWGVASVADFSADLSGAFFAGFVGFVGCLFEAFFDSFLGSCFPMIGAGDYAELLLLAPLSSRLAGAAPGVELVGVPQRPELVEQLRRGDFELAIGVFDGLPDDVRVEPLWDDRFVCVLRAEHPLVRARRRLTLRRYAELDHVLVAPRGQPRGVVDDLLAEHGLRRRVARSVTSFVAAPHLVAGGDYVLTVSERIAREVAEPLGLMVREPPLSLSPYTVSLCWQRRFDGDELHRWLREQLLALAHDADASYGRNSSSTMNTSEDDGERR